MGDEILSINGYPIKNNFGEWARYFGNTPVTLTASNTGKVRTVSFTPSSEEYYKVHYVQKTLTPTEEQVKNFTSWSRRRF